MGLVLGIGIEIATVVLSVFILFAGSMRTTGGNSDDAKTAGLVFACGSVIAALIAASHWIGW